MNSNPDDIHYRPGMPDEKCDELLDRYFESVTLPEVDAGTVMMLTHMKMLRDRLLRSRRIWRMVSLGTAAACVAIVLALNVGLPRHGADTGAAAVIAASDTTGGAFNKLTVPVGQRRTITLDDGTLLIANSRSEVRYPSHFHGDTRHIWASGEVYLEVAKDSTRPFILSADGFDIKVLGTRFCLSSYTPGEANVVLVEGSVAVSTECDERIRMRPNQKLTISGGTIDEIKEIDTAVYTSWTRGGLLLEDQTLGEIADRLNTYYDVDIRVDSALYSRRLYGRLDLKGDIKGILDVLASIIPMEIIAVDGTSSFRIVPAAETGHTSSHSKGISI